MRDSLVPALRPGAVAASVQRSPQHHALQGREAQRDLGHRQAETWSGQGPQGDRECTFGGSPSTGNPEGTEPVQGALAAPMGVSSTPALPYGSAWTAPAPPQAHLSPSAASQQA
ncbi:hypothetical protein P7K49_015198 [Saguinus oedipus]|uniref:Androgen receptor n=1 Tax=Saguinus oedipus TaxID=9490 RepID=A0ABQ9V9S9_SAGOE|nr:hypothetical protein P7K49_015198 [Saguinus oedipus]